MERNEELTREVRALRERLSRLAQASLRINESLDLDTVLQGVLDSARSLTGARYGLISTKDEHGGLAEFLTSGTTEEQHLEFVTLPEGMKIFHHFNQIRGPFRTDNFHTYAMEAGLNHRLPVTVWASVIAPIGLPGRSVGTIYLGHDTEDKEFTQDDVETLQLFASQAALVVSNVRRYREEQQARSDLETLMNTSPVGVVVFDAGTGAPVSFNQEARRIVDRLRDPDRSPEQLLEVLTVRRADGREFSLRELPIAEALSAAETVRAEEIVLTVPDGRSVTALVNATPIRLESGQVGSFVATLQDLTDMEELEWLRAEFLAMVSHELREPLTSIKGSIATLLDATAALDAAEVVQFHRIINSQTDRMRAMISDLLDVARIEMGALSISPEPTDVVGLVEDARSAFQASRRGNRLHVDLPAELPWVMADRARMAQVLGNLLANAARHSEESSPIRLTVTREEFQVTVSVSDDGRGVLPERLPHLFRKFSRIGEERTDGNERAGLGLAICKGIVEAHGGRIWAESDGPGLGAKFTFTLPVANEAETRAARPASGVVGASSQGEPEQVRVLAVDDDPQTLRHVRDALSRAGYIPIVTGDPGEALPLVEREKPHVVLLDLALPGIDGIDLMIEIAQLTDAPVIFLSAYGREETVTQALDLGAADYIVKPFSPMELGARIRAALRKREVPEPADPFVVGDLAVYFAERRVTLAGSPVRMTAVEYRLLAELAANAGRVLTYEHLLQQVWGAAGDGDLRPIRTALSKIRRRLGDDPDNPAYIFTEPRVGYRMLAGEGKGEPAGQ